MRPYIPARRAHERELALLPVDWHVFGSGVRRATTTADVSPDGAFVCTAIPAPRGTAVVLELGTSSGPLLVHARVAWTDARGMGVRFTVPVPVAGPLPRRPAPDLAS